MQKDRIAWRHPEMPRIHRGTLLEAVDYCLENLATLPSSFECVTGEGFLGVMPGTRSLAFILIEVKPEYRRQGKCRGLLRRACSSPHVDRVYVYMPNEIVLSILHAEGFTERAAAEFVFDARPAIVEKIGRQLLDLAGGAPELGELLGWLPVVCADLADLSDELYSRALSRAAGPPDAHLPLSWVPPLLEYGVKHLVGGPAADAATLGGFLRAVSTEGRVSLSCDAGAEAADDECKRVVIAEPLSDPAHRRIAMALYDVFMADKPWTSPLYELCARLGYKRSPRDADAEERDPVVLQLGVALCPDTNTVSLCAPPGALAGALPLLYLLRARIDDTAAADAPAPATATAIVVPPDLGLWLRREEGGLGDAADEHVYSPEGRRSVATELHRLPDYTQGSVRELLGFLRANVATRVRMAKRRAVEQLAAAGRPIQEEKGVRSEPTAADFLVHEAVWRVALLREGELSSVIRELECVEYGDDEDRSPGDLPPAGERSTAWGRAIRAIHRYLYLRHQQRRQRDEWWLVHRLPRAAGTQFFTITYTLAFEEACAPHVENVTARVTAAAAAAKE